MKKALVLVPPLIGHMIPMMNIMRELKGEYDFIIVNDMKYKNVWEQLGIKKFYHFPWHALKTRNNFSELYFYYHINYDNFFIGKFVENHQLEYDLIIADVFLYIGGILAKKYQKKIYTVFPSIFLIRKPFDETFQIDVNIFPFNIFYNLLSPLFLIFFNFFGIILGLKFKVIMLNLAGNFYMFANRVYFVIPPILNTNIVSYSSHTYIPYQTYDYLFFHNELPQIKNNKKNILISPGSLFNSEKRIKKILKYLEKSLNLQNYNLLIMSKTSFDIDWADVYFLHNVPLSKALDIAHIFVTHGGINSLLTYVQLKKQIPIIIFPQGVEQWENMKNFYKYIRRKI